MFMLKKIIMPNIQDILNGIDLPKGSTIVLLWRKKIKIM